MTMILEILIFAISFWIASKLLVNISMENAWVILPAGVIYFILLSLLNWFIPVSLTVATLGLISFSQVLTYLVASVLSFYLTSRIMDGYRVEGAGALIWGALIVTLASSIMRIFVG